MNRLPAVLLKEIYEFAHGDRSYWKSQFAHVLVELECTDWDMIRKMRKLGDAVPGYIIDFPTFRIGPTRLSIHRGYHIWKVDMEQIGYCADAGYHIWILTGMTNHNSLWEAKQYFRRQIINMCKTCRLKS